MSDDRGAGWWRRAGRLGIVVRSVLLGLVLGAAWGLSLPIAVAFGEESIQSSGVAAALCWLSGAHVAWMGSWFRDEQQVLIKVAGSLALRVSMPLAIGVWLIQTKEWAEKGGLAFYLIFFYQVMLATETTLDIAQIEAVQEDKKNRQDPPASE